MSKRKRAIEAEQEKRRPTLLLQGPLLTVILAPDEVEGMICAFCPELDLVTEMPTEEEALGDLLEALRDYAEEYEEESDLYAKSPNRAHHRPYIQAILKAKDDWELKTLLDIRYGVLHLR